MMRSAVAVLLLKAPAATINSLSTLSLSLPEPSLILTHSLFSTLKTKIPKQIFLPKKKDDMIILYLINDKPKQKKKSQSSFCLLDLSIKQELIQSGFCAEHSSDEMFAYLVQHQYGQRER